MERRQIIRLWLKDALVCFVTVTLLLLLANVPDWRLISLGIFGGLMVAYAVRKLYWNYRSNRLACMFFLGCFFLALLLQITKFYIFPKYYFFDAGSVQEIMITGNAGELGISYLNTARLCNLLKLLFPMESQLFGGLFFFFCGIPICAMTLSNVDFHMTSNWKKFVAIGLLLSYSVLLPVFVWNTQKEAIQFLFLALIATIFKQAPKRPLAVAWCYLLLMVIWCVSFRTYYLLILIGSLLFFLVLRIQNQKSRAIFLTALCLLIVIGLIAVKQIYPKLLTQLFESRAEILKKNTTFRMVNTAIVDTVPNPNRYILLYLLNYAINAARMMVPLELLCKGPLQICFVGWQLLITGLLDSAIFRCWKTSDFAPQNWQAAFVLCWYLVSFLFEPDFGSFVRHQAAVFPITFSLYCIVLRTNR